MEKERIDLEKRRGSVFAAIIAAAALGVVSVMALITLPSADDYWYRHYMDGGLGRYIDLMREHYMTFNGRVLVHVADHIVLRLGPWSFAIVCPSVLLAIPALLALAGRERGLGPWAAAIFASAVLSLPEGILNQGVLWTSAFFNYALPTAMLAAELALLETAARRGGAARVLCVLCSAAAGASTEQSGIAAVVLAAYFFAKGLRQGRAALVPALSLSGAVLGLLSVFLSPATMERLGRGASLGGLGGTLRAMYAHMGPASGEMCATWLVGVAMALFFLMSGAAASERLGRRWPLAAALVPAAMSLAVLFCPEGPRAAIFTALCAALALAAASLTVSGQDAPGLFVIAGVVTLAAVLVTDSAGDRTLLPFMLTLVGSDAVMLSARIRRLPRRLRPIAPMAALLAGIMAAAPFLGGMLRNLRVERENVENTALARKTGVMRYCLDYDGRYTWTKLQGEFMAEYLRWEGLDPDMPVEYYSRVRPGVIVDGKAQYPALLGGDGEPLVWLRVIEALGGETRLQGGYARMTLALPWMECELETSGDGRGVFIWSDGTGVHSKSVERVQAESRTWFPIWVYTDILKIDVTFDAAQNAYVFAPPAQLDSLTG